MATQMGKLLLLITALGLIIFPWFSQVENLCRSSRGFETTWCALSRGPMASLLILLGIFLALLFSRLNNIKRAEIYTVLHFVGLLALAGFIKISFFPGLFYGAGLVILAAYQTKSNKDMSASPVGVVLLLTILYGVSAWGGRDIFAGIQGGHNLFAAYLVCVLGVFWLNRWTKKESMWIYFLFVPSIIIVVMNLLLVYSAFSFKMF